MLLKLLGKAGSAETVIREIFDEAGVGVRGEKPGDILVKNDDFYGRMLRDASIGLGESYMDGWWECEEMDLFIEKLLRIDIKKKVQGSLRMKLLTVQAIVTNMQSRGRAKIVAEAHYDIGNDLYEVMLDPRMVYTCGYWPVDEAKKAKHAGPRAPSTPEVIADTLAEVSAESLAHAQERKLDLICRKAGLKPGMRVLDLGCGFGGFAMFAAERYGCHVRGHTISTQQQQWGAATAKKKGLDVDLRLDDYRNAQGQYDAVVSIGMLEHVGWKNLREFMLVVKRCLKPDGVSVLHTIGSPVTQKHGVPFFEKYIFPNASSPSIAMLGRAMEELFVLEDVQNIGPHYRPTLLAWWKNFNDNYKSLDQKKYDERFWRMWRFYLLISAGAVSARESQLYHVVMTHPGRAQPHCRLS